MKSNIGGEGKMKKRISLLGFVILVCILGVVSKQNVAQASVEKTITIGKKVDGHLKSGANDYYSFTPSKTGQLTITITGKVPEGLEATIFDKNDGTVYRTKTVDYDADKGNETVKYVVYVNPMKYRLRITGASISVSGKYTIKTSFKPLKETSATNHSKGKAYTISDDQCCKGYITIDGSKDYYKIKVKKEEKLKFSVKCNTDASVVVGIIKPSEKYVSISGSAGKNYTYDFDQSVPAGTYVIEISSDEGTKIEAGNSYAISTGNYVFTKKINTISKKDMYVGKTYKLKVTTTPKNATETLKYTSSNKKVATVSSTGKITAKAKGTATITITGADTGISKKVKIKVK